MNVAQWLGLAVQVSIMLTVLAFGLTATFEDATYLLRTPKLLLRTVVSMNIVMPIIAGLMATSLSLPFEVNIALGALMVSPVPPIIQRSQISAGGRREYVVGLMVAMSLLAIVIVPLAVIIVDHIFNRAGVVTPGKVAKIMFMSVLAPLLAGLLIRRWIPAAQKATGAILAVAGILLIVGVAVLLYGLWPVTREFLHGGVALMLAVLAIIGLAVGHLLGGPLASDRTVLAMSTSSRHPAVALAIATSGPLGVLKPELAIILLYVIIATVIGIPYKKWRIRTSGVGTVGAKA
jgi:bile acid:Na+ symporter, BASS family